MQKRGGLRDDELTFDRIAFNFPHVGLGIKDQARCYVACTNPTHDSNAERLHIVNWPIGCGACLVDESCVWRVI